MEAPIPLLQQLNMLKKNFQEPEEITSNCHRAQILYKLKN